MLWREKNISYFLVWTSAHFPGLNIGRCCCCAVGEQLYLAPALLGLSAPLEGLCLFLCLWQWPATEPEMCHIGTETRVNSKGNLQLVTT